MTQPTNIEQLKAAAREKYPETEIADHVIICNIDHDDLDEIVTSTALQVEKDTNAKWIEAFGKNFSKSQQEVIKNAFQQGVDMTKEQYENALQSLKQTKD